MVTISVRAKAKTITKGKKMRRRDFDINDIIKWIIIAIFAILFYAALNGCNPVKQVLKSKESTEKVVRQYVKDNPPKNDTTFIPGDTVQINYVVKDSVKLPYPVNHKYTEYHYIDRTIRDTVKVLDRSFIDALNNRLTALEKDFTEMKADRDTWKSKAQVRLYWLIALLVIILGAGVFYVIKILQPKITLMK
jgi:hypothetical protein